MSVRSVRPLFIDTGAFYAWFKESDDNHNNAEAIFQSIRSQSLPYQPLFTSRYVLSELATLILYNDGHREAIRAFDAVYTSESFTFLTVSKEIYAAAREEFGRYNDHDISFVDHLSGVLADEHDIERIFAFDDDFRTPGLTLVPGDTGEP